jgi:hypothetical protein
MREDFWINFEEGLHVHFSHIDFYLAAGRG